MQFRGYKLLCTVQLLSRLVAGVTNDSKVAGHSIYGTNENMHGEGLT